MTEVFSNKKLKTKQNNKKNTSRNFFEKHFSKHSDEKRRKFELFPHPFKDLFVAEDLILQLMLKEVV